MKRYMLFLAALGVTLCSYGQQFWELNPQKADLTARRIYRTEVVPFETRHDAEAGKIEASGYSITFAP